MKYRIKIVSHSILRTEFFPQKKKFWGWAGLAYDGDEGYSIPAQSRNSALDAIDLNYQKYEDKILTIDFEYINK